MKSLTTTLVQYAITQLDLPKEDGLYWHHFIQQELNESSPLELEELQLDPSITLENLSSALSQAFPNLSEELLTKKLNRLLGWLTPSPSVINERFWREHEKQGFAAFQHFYDLQIRNGYVLEKAIAKNVKWDATVNGYPLEITINLSKPEKNNAETAKLLKQSAIKNEYPSCLICKQNLGYSGNEVKASRENMRHLSIQLDDHPWFLQFSPYAYYPYHCIVIDEKHTPMKLNGATLSKLYAFVDQFPYLFIGMNSDLPIVGGSILNHAHFQGGRYQMPMMKVAVRSTYFLRGFKGELHELNWLNNAFRYDSASKEDALALISHVEANWKQFRNENLDIIPHTDQPHNSLTVIVNKQAHVYQTYFILRNNRTNEKYPQGIFHAHPEHHAIKQESIGLIEAMGLFILPGRLKNAIESIASLPKNAEVPEALLRYRSMIQALHESNTKDPQMFLKSWINQTCYHILENTAVFKSTTEGQRGLREWIHGLHR